MLSLFGSVDTNLDSQISRLDILRKTRSPTCVETAQSSLSGHLFSYGSKMCSYYVCCCAYSRARVYSTAILILETGASMMSILYLQIMHSSV